MGSQGADVWLSEVAHTAFPFGIECKNKETNKSLLDDFDQAVEHCTNAWPLLVLGANNREPLAVVELTTFIHLMKKVQEYELSKVQNRSTR